MTRSDQPNRARKLARNLRRRANIFRRLAQLDRDFEAAETMESELRINEEIAQQREYLARCERRLVEGATIRA